MKKKNLLLYFSLFTMLLTLMVLPMTVRKTSDLTETREIRRRAAEPTPVPGEVVLMLSPPSGSLYIGEDQQIQILLSTGGNQVSGVDVIINYDPSVFTVTNVDSGNIAEFVSYPAKSFDQSIGRIELSASIGGGGTPVMGDNLVLGVITLHSINPSAATTLSFEYTPIDDPNTPEIEPRNDCNVVKYGQSDILDRVFNAAYQTSVRPTNTPSPTNTPIPTNTPTPTPTITPTPTPVPTLYLSLQIEMEGRDVITGQSRPTAIRLVGTNFDQTLQTDARGRIIDQYLADILPGTYDILIKPNGFLQRKVTVSLNAGQNDISSSLFGLKFLGGDVNNSGKINSLDYNILYINYNSNDQTCDLDGSGKVNAIDVDLMIKNWNMVGDDEGTS